MFPIVLFTRLRSWIRNRKSALTYLPKKISIRLSVLLIILPLLIGISTITLSTNYIALNSLLIATENNSISCSSEKVSEQISSYFKPLNTTTSTAFHMLNEGIVKLEYSDIFIKFLYSIIVNDANISGAFWGDIAGNFYSLYKVDSNYLEQITLRDGKNKKSIERIFNSQGKLLSAKKLPFDGRDPRVRPWYKQAKLKKQQIWITYKFLKVANQKESLGVTAAFPLYNSKGNLLGVFGVDMLVETISKYINDIKITKNSVIFLADDVDNLISVHDKNKNLLEDYELIKIPDLTKPWLKKSFTIYQQTHKSPFMYSFNNNKYISAYGKIADVKSEKPWFVAIVVPVVNG